jgi:Ca-activated chloride channel family protein
MKRLLFLIPLFLLLVVLPATAQEIPPCPLPPPCPMDATCPAVPPCPVIQPGVFTNPQWLRIPYHHVQVDVVDQIATTTVEMEFINEGNGLAEGTFLFPLPDEAAVDQLIMTVNGVDIQANILPADQARAIYNEIVRQYRDPALLEYVGRSLLQASVFPIPPGESRRIQIRYGQALSADNGLLHYVYPLKVTNFLSQRPVEQMSLRLSVNGRDPISNIYSPTHPIAVQREGDTGFRAGFESANVVPGEDFSLFYGLANDSISLNLLTYKESAADDGFFLLMIQPPITIPAEQIIPRDVIVVLDQSGSMLGEKWEQAKEAAIYVLQNLNPQDRFNVVLFSTGWRVYGNEMQPVEGASAAVEWIRTQEAVGGTDINGALTTALGMVGERQTTILFLTDGLASEGIIETPAILGNLEAAAKPNARIFTFGVGDDVDTVLLDSIVRDHRGTGAYVRPGERIQEEVASLYNKISAPVLTDVTLDLGGLNASDLYPKLPLPDLFAGTQLTLTGRYRGDAANLSFILRGNVNGQPQTFTYSGLNVQAVAGGEAFIARLWATRRIGDLLNTIRLNGENPELVQSVVSLSVRYGIITPYTSFLITEDDILTQQGQAEAADQFAQASRESNAVSGAGAVSAADAAQNLQAAAAPLAMPTMTAMPLAVMPVGTMAPPGEPMPGQPESVINPVQSVGGKTFLYQAGVWTDTTFQSDTMTTQPVAFLSDAYFALLDRLPELAPYFALGERVIVVLDGVAYEVTAG